jgi:hypothetical protein
MFSPFPSAGVLHSRGRSPLVEHLRRHRQHSVLFA